MIRAEAVLGLPGYQITGIEERLRARLDGHHWLFSRHAKDRSPEEWGAVVKR